MCKNIKGKLGDLTKKLPLSNEKNQINETNEIYRIDEIDKMI